MRETAYAKINLALHVRRLRGDGYHEVETLFAFLDQGDEVSARTAPTDRVDMTGEFAQALANPFDNIAAKALGHLPRPGGLAITIDKRLPVAAGLGGGSADAGAVFRLVRSANGLPGDWRSRAARLGADVPACVQSTTCIGSGTGTELTSIDNDLRGTPALLVNPRKRLSTGPVFAAWDGEDRGPLPTGPASVIARQGRNDLEAPAIGLCPDIALVLSALEQSEAYVSRMSGSGASCFALFETEEMRDRVAQRLTKNHPAWWQMKGFLR